MSSKASKHGNKHGHYDNLVKNPIKNGYALLFMEAFFLIIAGSEISSAVVSLLF
jgi:hypothetical protein